MRSGDAFGDGEAEPRAPVIAGAGVIEPAEAFEDSLVMFGGYARAVVEDLKDGLPVLAVAGETDRDGAGGVAFGVV